jgi:AcrR family transcriptional regulator
MDSTMGVKTVLSGREALLDAGRNLFLVHGYTDVSMQQIAEAAGMTKGAPYYHFKNKDELFMEVFQQEIDRIKDGFVSHLSAGGPLRRRLQKATAFIISNTQSDLSRLFSDFEHCVAPGYQKDAEQSAREHANMVNKLLPFFVEAQARGEFTRRTPEQATYLFLLLAIGQMQWMRNEENRGILGNTPDEIAGKLMETLFDGI